MPLMKVYNIDSDLYGLKGHSIFKSVCNTRSIVKRNLRPSYINIFSRKPLLPRRPSATKHRPNRGGSAWSGAGARGRVGRRPTRPTSGGDDAGTVP
jgi:hypothetical protein